MLSLTKQIRIASLAVLVPAFLMAGIGILKSRRIHTQLAESLNQSQPASHALRQIESLARDTRAKALLHLSQPDASNKSRLESEMRQLKARFYEVHAGLERLPGVSSQREVHKQLAFRFDHYLALWAPVQVLSQALKHSEAVQLYAQSAGPAFEELLREAAACASQGHSEERSRLVALQTESSSMTWWLSILVTTMMGAALAALLSLRRGIGHSLKEISHTLCTHVEKLAASAAHVTSGSRTLAEGASNQASSIEETSASTEELASMTRKNADNTRNAVELMNQVDQKVADANRTLVEMVTSMNEITSSSGKISQIIKVIDGIAFQTNILALNAAVEAARAGEAGMGFAVVADEVRNLAQRSAQAARDTAQLIEESISRSQEGKAKLEEVARSIHGITDGATRVKGLVDDVNISSQEQSRGIEQIGRAIVQIEHVTQTSAATAQQSASSSEDLTQISAAMRLSLGRLQALLESAEPSSTAAAATLRRGQPGTRLPIPPSRVARVTPLMTGTARRDTPVRKLAPSQVIPLDEDFKAF